MVDIPTEATLRVVHREDGSYAVEVTIPETNPTIVSGFDSEASAEAWIVRYREGVEAKLARKKRGRRMASGS